MVWIEKGVTWTFWNVCAPVMEELKLAEVEHNPKNNRMRAL
jgi:hypothetical protein